MTQEPFKWGEPQDTSPIQDLRDLARFAVAKMTDDLNRADGRVDAMFRAFGIEPPRRSSWTVVSPATYANMLDIAEREGFPFDKPAVKTPRARGAVASWVLGRFAEVDQPAMPDPKVIYDPDAITWTENGRGRGAVVGRVV